MDDMQGKKSGFQLFVEKVKCKIFDAITVLLKERKIGKHILTVRTLIYKRINVYYDLSTHRLSL